MGRSSLECLRSVGCMGGGWLYRLLMCDVGDVGKIDHEI